MGISFVSFEKVQLASFSQHSVTFTMNCNSSDTSNKFFVKLLRLTFDIDKNLFVISQPIPDKLATTPLTEQARLLPTPIETHSTYSSWDSRLFRYLMPFTTEWLHRVSLKKSFMTDEFPPKIWSIDASTLLSFKTETRLKIVPSETFNWLSKILVAFSVEIILLFRHEIM